MSEDSYSIKEIVDSTRQEQTAGFTRIEVLLAGKADKADLVPIHERLTLHDSRLRNLEDGRLVDDAVIERIDRKGQVRWDRVGIVAAICMAAGAIGTIVVTVFH